MDYDASQPLLPQSTVNAGEDLVQLCPDGGQDRSMMSFSDLPADLVGVEPTLGAGCCIDISPYLPVSAEVNFVNLEGRIFEKYQSRGGGKAKQRIIDGKVQITVKSDQAQEDISCISVWVRREPKAANANKDSNGDVELVAVCVEKKRTHYVYQVNLDSVYDGPMGPVYKLARVDVEERNKFELVVQVHYYSWVNTERVASKPFLIRTHKKEAEKEPRGAKRPFYTWSASTKRHAGEGTSYVTPAENPDSTTNSPSSAAPQVSAVTPTNDLVVRHLEAQRANIEHLQCSTLNTTRGDIAYHMRLTDPDLCQNLQEGVVVGFFPDSEGGTQIAPLTSEKSNEAVMAGVISRSAYIQAHAPALKDEGKTDIVCVIGMVKVQMEGNVQSGERIYASTNLPGTAIPESHLPLRIFMTKSHTLLGMAMEDCKPGKPGINLVKCFVCIVLGINDQLMMSEVENILDIVEMDIKAALNRFKKRTWKRIVCLVLAALLVLGLLEFLLFSFIAPGTWLRYLLCKRGCMPGNELKFNLYNGDEHCPVHGIQFKFDKIKHKFEPDREIRKLDDSDGCRYFLNLDRCAWGGKRDRSELPGHDHPVCAGRVLAVYANCSQVYEYKRGKWNPYNTSRVSDLKCIR